MRYRILALVLFGTTIWAANAIRLKSRNIVPSSPRPATLGRHFLVQFQAEPGTELRAELTRRGIRVLGSVPQAGLMVSSPEEPDLDGLGVTWAGPLEISDKLSRELFRARHAAYLVIFH